MTNAEIKKESKAANKTVKTLCGLAQILCDECGAEVENEIITLLNAAKIVCGCIEVKESSWDLFFEKKEHITKKLVESYKDEILDKMDF